MSKVVRLQTGTLEMPQEKELPGLTKTALLVYEGSFMSMDGEVIVERSDLMRLVENHNAYIQKMCELEACGPDELPRRKYPPLQLDHSSSAKDTVGRLVGLISLKPYVREDGVEVLGVYGDVLVLGEDNIEKTLDGRWTNLSVGVDFGAGKFSELTITPFPAASEAALLASKEVKLKGDTMDKEKLKKYLTEEKKMSEEEADKKLSEGSEEELSKLSNEMDENEKLAAGDIDKMSGDKEDDDKLAAGDVDKMSEEDQEKEKLKKKKMEEEKDKDTKMSAAREKLTRLSTDFRKHTEGAQLAARKGQITSRLSRLKSSAKITPAEVKKIDVAKLSSRSQEVIDEVLATYESREPVVMVGQYGSMKAEELHKLTKQSQLSQLEAETRANMSLLRKTTPKDTRLSSSDQNTEMAGYDSDKALSEIEKLMEEGKTAEAMKKMRDCLKKAKMSSHTDGDEKMSSEETEKQLSTLAESVNKMQAQFEELHKLAGSFVGLN